MQVKVSLISKFGRIPQRMTDLSAGYDIYSANDQDIIIKPNKTELIPTGFVLSLPAFYEAQIRPRSGLALSHGITVLNSPGTIDPDYRGEVKVMLINLGQKEFIVKTHMRIAQMIISSYNAPELVLSETLDETKRGSNGFGHTKF